MQQWLVAFKPRPICEVSLTEQGYFEDYIPGAVLEYGEIRVMRPKSSTLPAA